MGLRQRKTPLKPAGRASNVVPMSVAMPVQGGAFPPPPSDLEGPEQELWAQLVSTYVLDDPASLAVLKTGLEARGRARRCRRAIDAQGEAIPSERFGLRPHPLLVPERTSQQVFLQSLKALRLDSGAV